MLSIIYLISSFLGVLAPLPGFYSAVKHGDLKQIRGPYIFSLLLFSSVWFLYGDAAKVDIYQNPLVLFISLLYSLTALVLKQQYANIVYHHVIIVNSSWYLRQSKPDEIFYACLISSVFYVYGHPIYKLYKAMKNKDSTELKPSDTIIQALKHIFFCIFYFFLGAHQVFLGFHVGGILLFLVQLKVRRALLELDRVNKKKDN